MRVVEAILLLLFARLLILLVPMRYWRASLGKSVASGASAGEAAIPSVHAVTSAVNRAATRLPIPVACLPRAMAAQWMLARRGMSPTLVIGVAAGVASKPSHHLHAWVEVDGRIVIGSDQSRHYDRSLALQSERGTEKI